MRMTRRYSLTPAMTVAERLCGCTQDCTCQTSSFELTLGPCLTHHLLTIRIQGIVDNPLCLVTPSGRERLLAERRKSMPQTWPVQVTVNGVQYEADDDRSCGRDKELGAIPLTRPPQW